MLPGHPSSLIAARRYPDVRRVALNLAGPAANVRLRVSDIHGLMRADLPAELLDLLEVAAYVSAADQSAPRSVRADDLGDAWRRRFHFR